MFQNSFAPEERNIHHYWVNIINIAKTNNMPILHK